MAKKGTPSGEEYWEVANDNALVFTYVEAQRMGISATRFKAALDTLLERGFVHIVKTGHGIRQNVTFYGLDDGWKTWRPGDQPVAVRKKRKPSNSPGCFQSGNKMWEGKKATVKKTRRSTVENTRTAEDEK